jgi:hypothetical protein
VEGRLPTNISYPAVNISAASAQNFSCVIEEKYDEIDYDWSISLCKLENLDWGDYQNQQSLLPPLFSATREFLDMYLMFNLSVGVSKGTLVPLNSSAWMNSSAGPWSTILAPRAPGTAPFMMNTTLCFAAASQSNLLVNASGTRQETESSLNFTLSSSNPNQSTIKFNTFRMREALNAGSHVSDPISRNLFNLSTPETWRTVRNQIHDYGSVDGPGRKWVDAARRSGSLDGDITKYLFAEGSKSVHITLRTVFRDIMEDTKNPAKALQALLTMVSGAYYYDSLQYLEDSEPATMVISTSAKIPVRWTGLVCVMALLAIHFVLVITSLVLFTKTENSLLGNAWQPVAQVATSEARHYIPLAVHSRDKEVKKVLKNQGADRKLVSLKDD